MASLKVANMNKTYIIRYANQSSEIDQDNWGSDCWHLVDTRINKVVWSDCMEPEDAILPRDLRDLVTLLNEEASR